MSGLFSPKIPKPKPAAPLPNEKQLQAARKRQVSAESKTSGSSSTLLSTGGRETLGA